MSFVMSSTIQPSRVRYHLVDNEDVIRGTYTSLEDAKAVAMYTNHKVHINYQEIK